jgi:serine/threonine-protein kinase
VAVLEGVGTGTAAALGTGAAAYFDLAGNGTLVYSPSTTIQAQRTLVWVDRQSREEPIGAPPRAYVVPRISPDGSQIALDVRDQENDIWMWTIARGTLTRLTFDRTLDRQPEWTPDGRRILFESDRAGNGGLYWQPADGTGKAEPLTKTTTGIAFPSGVSPDGTRALFWALASPDVMSVALDGAGRVQPLVQTQFVERNGIVSPDGRWIAYDSNASTRFEVYVRPYPDVAAGQWQVSTAGGTRPLWAHSGRELFDLGPDGALMRVPVEPGATWAAGVPTRLLAGQYLDGDSVTISSRTYDISLDDRRFLMIKEGETRDAGGPSLIVVQNWFEELKRLVPATR